MFRMLSIFIPVILLVSSISYAGVHPQGGFFVGTSNSVKICGGIDSAHGQNMTIIAHNQSMIGCGVCLSIKQSQNICLSLGQGVYRHGGCGGACSVQSYSSIQNQTLITPKGICIQSQLAGVLQVGSACGGHCSNACIRQSIHISASQHQSF